MRWTQSLIPTLRESPAGVDDIGQRLLIRAGMIRLLPHSGCAFLPLGLRTVHKIAGIFSDELDDLINGEVAFGSSEAGPIATAISLVGASVRSYRQLPLVLRQTMNEPPGLVRLYHFNASESQLADIQRKTIAAIDQSLTRCGARSLRVDTQASQDHVALSPDGDNPVIVSDRGNYAAAPDVAETGHRPSAFAGEPAGDLMKIPTPGLTSVAEVCQALEITPRRILKTMVFEATSPIAIRWVVAVVRGDHHVNQWKLSRAAREMGVITLRLADSPEFGQKFAIGYVGPDGGTKVADAILIVDPDAAQGDIPWAAGANETGFHVTNFNWFREAGDKLSDPAKVMVADIRNAVEGDPSPKNDAGVLSIQRGHLLARSSNLGTDPSTRLNVRFVTEAGVEAPFWLGTSEIDLAKIMSTLAETSHDDLGIVWPPAIAPYSVVITPIKYDSAVKHAADSLYEQLTFEGIDVILDDRDARPGQKFADADLIGFPVRINVGQKVLDEGQVELKRRSASAIERLKLDDEIIPHIRAALTM
jgi:prolyl-tRNA synthetase